MDFVIELGGKVVPIEVKSGKDYQRHSALSNVLSNKDYQIDEAIMFCNDNLSQSNHIVYLPIYMVVFLVKFSLTPLSYSVDLTGLK